MKLIHMTGLNAEFEGYVSDAGRGQLLRLLEQIPFDDYI